MDVGTGWGRSGGPVWRAGLDRLYDVLADPQAANDVSDQHRMVVSALRRRIFLWRASMEGLIEEQRLPDTPPQTGSSEDV